MAVEVAPGVFAGLGTDVNFYLVRDGSDLTLVDTGWAGDLERVLAAVHAVGCRPEDVRAILLTHAHVDHLGAVNHFRDRYGTPLYTDPVEVRHAHREYLEQAGVGAVVRNIARPGVLAWAARVARVGALGAITAAHAEPFPEPLDLPGGPVPIATHGHTSGHVAFWFPGSGAVATGDALVTGHPTSSTEGPQVLGAMFSHGDPLPALDALAGLDGDLVLPGHGPVHRGAIAAAVEQARSSA